MMSITCVNRVNESNIIMHMYAKHPVMILQQNTSWKINLLRDKGK